jgi:DNA polymerase elongation subunit (family B)
VEANATTFALESSPLYGSDPRPGIIAVEPLGDRVMELVLAGPGGTRERIRQPFRPSLWLERRELLQGFAGAARVTITELAGGGELKLLAEVESGRELDALQRHLKIASGESAGSRLAPYLHLGDRVHLHLLQTGQTLFKGLVFEDLRRLAIAIQTDCAPGFEFSNPERESDRVRSITLAGSDSFEAVIAGDRSEPEMLAELEELIRTRDPDVITGHNCFKLDFEYLRVRAARYGQELRWGREGAVPRRRPSRIPVAERVLDVPRWEARGRHLIDTWLLAQFYDVSSRALESFDLTDVAQHFGVAGTEREEGAAARAIDRLTALLLPSYFLQTQIFPYSLQTVVVRGNATKINALFLREYRRLGQAIPALPPTPPRDIAGGHTAVFQQGLVGPVLHADVRSLYPSIMLVDHVRPPRDELDLMSGMLLQLRDFRLAARRAMATARSPVERHHLDALQSTFKILINSFYGYLGSTFANWADAAAANQVTGRGREIVHLMLAGIERRGGQPIEVDTDGVYFVPPPAAAADERGAEAFIAELAQDLPPGIQVELAGRYRAMLSYKAKNYALLDEQGRVAITGSGLRSRGLEPYLREFLHELLSLALAGRAAEIPDAYARAQARLDAHAYVIRDLAKTETLADSLVIYRGKIADGARNRSAAYELALASGRDLRPGDQVSYYVTGDSPRVTVAQAARPVSAWDKSRPDENTAYYRAKLRELYEKFAPIVGVDLGGQEAFDF